MTESQGAEHSVAATAAPSAPGPSSARPPFRADHVGSLLRPPEVLQARDDFAAGRISADDLRGVEDAAIREVVRKQQEAGLRSATDGEFRRESWHMDFIYQLGGIQKVQDDTIRVAFHNEQKTYEWAPPSAHVVAPLTLEHTIFGEAFTFLAGAVSSSAGTTTVPKLTIPSLSMVHYRGGRSAIDASVYPDLDQFWTDLAAAYAEEVRRLYDLGCQAAGRGGQTLKPSARSCSRPSSVILSGPHGGSHTQLMRKSATSPSSAERAWSSITSVSGHAALVSVMSMVATRSSATVTP